MSRRWDLCPFVMCIGCRADMFWVAQGCQVAGDLAYDYSGHRILFWQIVLCGSALGTLLERFYNWPPGRKRAKKVQKSVPSVRWLYEYVRICTRNLNWLFGPFGIFVPWAVMAYSSCLGIYSKIKTHHREYFQRKAPLEL